MLRVFVQGGGCSGFQYGFQFEESVEEDDAGFGDDDDDSEEDSSDEDEGGDSDASVDDALGPCPDAAYEKAMKKALKTAFNMIDTDNSGDIDQDEFRNAVRKGGRLTAAMLSDTDLDRRFVCADTEDSGAVSIDEMIALVWDSDSEGPAAPAE